MDRVFLGRRGAIFLIDPTGRKRAGKGPTKLAVPWFQFWNSPHRFLVNLREEVRTVDYKGIEFSVVQTANPMGWKWTVFPDGIRTRTGIAHSRAHAVLDAERAIDKAIKDLDRAT
jgi:hypothetical protein